MLHWAVLIYNLILFSVSTTPNYYQKLLFGTKEHEVSTPVFVDSYPAENMAAVQNCVSFVMFSHILSSESGWLRTPPCHVILRIIDLLLSVL
jgi:hypothetical protein